MINTNIHSEPHIIVMGANPSEYWIDSVSRFNVIVNLMDHPGHSTIPGAVVMHYSMIDMEDEEFVPDKDRSEDFLWAVHLFASTGTSFWHCRAGLNRSGYMLATYLHLYRQFRIKDAISLLREKRSHQVLNNSVFERALIKRYSLN